MSNSLPQFKLRFATCRVPASEPPTPEDAVATAEGHSACRRQIGARLRIQRIKGAIRQQDSPVGPKERRASLKSDAWKPEAPETTSAVPWKLFKVLNSK